MYVYTSIGLKNTFGWCNKQNQYLETKYLFDDPNDTVTHLCAIYLCVYAQ